MGVWLRDAGRGSQKKESAGEGPALPASSSQEHAYTRRRFQNGNRCFLRAFCGSGRACRELEFPLKDRSTWSLGRTLCMPKKLLVVVLFLSAVAAVAATTDANSQPVTSAPAIKSYLMPDLSFKNVFALDLLQPSEAVAAQPDATAIGATKLGFCQCGCGIRCSTSADCGGNACRPFITCCARKTQTPEVDWFTRSFESSSHKTALPDAVLKEVLKAECK